VIDDDLAGKLVSKSLGSRGARGAVPSMSAGRERERADHITRPMIGGRVTVRKEVRCDAALLTSAFKLYLGN
jgi:hypothetical protein